MNTTVAEDWMTAVGPRLGRELFDGLAPLPVLALLLGKLAGAEAAR